MNYPHIMVDLETLDNVPGGVILSIGAVGFNAQTGQLGPEFYAVLDKSSCDFLGLTTSTETLNWWASQSDEARAVLRDATGGSGLHADLVAQEFSNWIGTHFERDKVHMWSNGADFDLPFLQVLYARCGLRLPWKFYNNRCYRTLKNLFGGLVPKPEFDGTKHNALDDAIFQAKHAIPLLRVLQTAASLYETADMAIRNPNRVWVNAPTFVEMSFDGKALFGDNLKLEEVAQQNSEAAAAAGLAPAAGGLTNA
jgi:hypothetical protein